MCKLSGYSDLLILNVSLLFHGFSNVTEVVYSNHTIALPSVVCNLIEKLSTSRFQCQGESTTSELMLANVNDMVTISSSCFLYCGN